MTYVPKKMNPAWRWMRSNIVNLSFTANKVVVIRDWRLAALNIFFSVAIVGWVIFSLFLGKTYIVTEVPTGVASAWGLASTDYTSTQTAIYNGDASFCDSLTNYKFKYSDDWIYETPVCAYYSGAELISKLPSGNVMFFTTHIHQTIIQRYMKNAGSCTRYPWLFDTGTEVMGRCEHSISKNFLASGIEDSYFAFNHYFDSSVESGAKPITYIRREGSEENLYIFEKGESIRLKVSEWLDIAEIKLDKPFNEQKGDWDITGFEGAGEDSQNYPYVRTSGVRLNIKVKYHNFHLDKEFKVKIGNDDVYAVITVSPKIGWFSKGDEILYSQDFYTTDSFETNNPVILNTGQPNGIYYDFYRYGILFDIQQTGLVGEVDYVFILIQLTSGVVMLGIATTLVSFIAKFALGNKSEIYRGVIQEEYEVGREAARYAAQACVATKSFKDADEDGKGDLDFDELRALIKESFSKNYLDEGNDTHFTEDEITGMAYYLMRAADDHLNDRILDKREKTPDELRHSKISLHEWQELSTNGVFKFKNLKATSTEHIKNTGWKRDSLKKRKSVMNLKNSNEV